MLFHNSKLFCFPLALLLAIVAAGCGNSCWFISANNDNNNANIIVNTNTCPGLKVNLNVNLPAAATCEMCPAATRVDHAFVNLRSIRLRSAAADDTDSSHWLELAPQLAKEPRQIDLIGDSSVMLVENAEVPAGTYRDVQLQFVSDSSESAEPLPIENACGGRAWNCVIAGDRHLSGLYGTGKLSEMVIPLEAADGKPVTLYPNSTVELRLTLHPQTRLQSGTAGLSIEHTLAAKAEFGRGSLQQ
jgi:hypothetical protein